MGEDGRKMSKSFGNVINPDQVVDEFGADSLRLFEMFLGPLETSKPWSKTGIEGVNRFLNRLWRMIVNDDGKLSESIKDIELNDEQEYVLNYTIKKISDDIENLSFNTAVSQMMIFVNEFMKYNERPKKAIEKFVLALAPFVPHIAEELWEILGNKFSIFEEKYPEYDESKIVKKNVEVVVQVNSKIRGKLSMAAGSSQEEVEAAALIDDNVQKYLEGKTIRKIIFVKDKIFNIIAN